MKKSILILIIFTIQAFSQSGRALYKIKFVEKIEVPKEYSEDVKQTFVQLYEDVNHMKFELIFNKNISKFNFIDDLNSISSMSKAIVNTNTIFTESKTNYSLIGNNLLKTNPVYNWKIENTTKLIGNLNCTKATCEIIFFSRKRNKEVTKTVEAWFCPSLPYSFGPYGYYGLPGIIVELNEGNKIYILEKIDLKFNEKIPIPNKKHITENEFNTYVESLKN